MNEKRCDEHSWRPKMKSHSSSVHERESIRLQYPTKCLRFDLCSGCGVNGAQQMEPIFFLANGDWLMYGIGTLHEPKMRRRWSQQAIDVGSSAKTIHFHCVWPPFVRCRGAKHSIRHVLCIENNRNNWRCQRGVYRSIHRSIRRHRRRPHQPLAFYFWAKNETLPIASKQWWMNTNKK